MRGLRATAIRPKLPCYDPRVDRIDLTGRLTKLRAELAAIHSEIVEYRSRKRHSQLEEKVHSERDVRIREIRAELEGMMKKKSPRR